MLDRDTKLEFAYALGLLMFFGAGSIFLWFGPKEFIQIMAINYVPNLILPIAITMLYIRSAILRPRFAKKIELSPIKSQNYKTQYVIDACSTSAWFAIDMIGLASLSLGFFAAGWDLEGTEFIKLEFLDKFFTFGVFPYLALTLFLISKKRI